MIANFKAHHLILSIALLCSIFSVILIAWNVQYIQSQDRILPHVTIDAVDVGNITKEKALAQLRRRYDYIADITTTVLYKDQPVATFSAEQLKLRRDVTETVDHAYLVGRSDHLPSRYMQVLSAMLGIHTYHFKTTLYYDESPVSDLLEEMHTAYEKPAKNALFTFENGKVSAFKEHENGLRLKKDQFLVALFKGLEESRPGSTTLTVTMSDEVLEPEITTAQSNNFGIEGVIGIGKSDYSHSIPTRVHNVKLAASKFNGVLIPQGETFSFNKVIGDISSGTGYQPAYVIKNGRTVLGDGGGVCQVSTTMFRAALNTGLPIIERNAHAYRVGYYENDSKPGFDATIFSPSVDLKVQNDTAAAILILTSIDDDHNLLTFTLYGKKDDRKIEISPVTIWDVVPPPEPMYQDDPTLPNGVVKQVDFPAWGSKAKFTYKVSKPGGGMFEKEFVSSYRPWQAVFLKGTAG